MPDLLPCSSMPIALLSVASAALFFFTDTATTEIYTLSLHDAFRSRRAHRASANAGSCSAADWCPDIRRREDRKSTRLNSSHVSISYAVFCLKKKNYRINYKHHPYLHYFYV